MRDVRGVFRGSDCSPSRRSHYSALAARRRRGAARCAPAALALGPARRPGPRRRSRDRRWGGARRVRCRVRGLPSSVLRAGLIDFDPATDAGPALSRCVLVRDLDRGRGRGDRGGPDRPLGCRPRRPRPGCRGGSASPAGEQRASGRRRRRLAMNGIPIARLFGIEIRVHLGWVVVSALVARASPSASSRSPSRPSIRRWRGSSAASWRSASSSAPAPRPGPRASSPDDGGSTFVDGVSFFGGATPLDPIVPNPGDELAIAVAGPSSASCSGSRCWPWPSRPIAGRHGDGAIDCRDAGVLARPQPDPRARSTSCRPTRSTAAGSSGPSAGAGRDDPRAGARRPKRPLDGLRRGRHRDRVIALGEFTSGAMIALSGWFLVLSARLDRGTDAGRCPHRRAPRRGRDGDRLGDASGRA